MFYKKNVCLRKFGVLTDQSDLSAQIAIFVQIDISPIVQLFIKSHLYILFGSQLHIGSHTYEKHLPSLFRLIGEKPLRCYETIVNELLENYVGYLTDKYETKLIWSFITRSIHVSLIVWVFVLLFVQLGINLAIQFDERLNAGSFKTPHLGIFHPF